MTGGPDQQRAQQERLEEIVAGYLEQVAGGAAELPESLLAQHPEFADELAEFFTVRGQIDAAVAPLRAVMLSGDGTVPEPDLVADRDGRLGDFRLMREVGRGGMGIVYEAEQLSLGRRVALKVLPFASTLDPRQLQRFKNEALAAGALDHPNVVDVYGVGCERGTHYYAMRFIEGHSLAEVVEQLRRLGRAQCHPLPDSVSRVFAGGAAAACGPLPLDPAAETRTAAIVGITRRSSFPPAYFRSVAELGSRVAEALEHAHRQGVVHRDIKPSNLLLDAQGKVWVADFGLARLDAASPLTGTGNVVGTLRYMAPEQALGRPADHRGDVYSLGVTLYELLTLQPAFPRAEREELLREIASAEPISPRRLDRSIPTDLETVVLKAMARNPEERYFSAQALADDLRRFVEDRPILARRPGVVLRLRRWCRRHRPAVATTASAAAFLLVLAVVGLVASHRAVTRERDQTRAAEKQGRHRIFDALAAQARASRQSRQVGQRLETWKTVTEAAKLARELELGEEHVSELRNEAIASLALDDVRLIKSWEGHPPGSTDRPTFNADLDVYARSDRKGNISVRRVSDDQELHSLRGPARTSDVGGVAESGAAWMWFSPDGTLLAVLYYPESNQSAIFRLWDWGRERVVFEPPFTVTGSAVSFSPDGKNLALGRPDGTISVHDVAWLDDEPRTLKTNVMPISLSYSSDSAKLAVASFAHKQVLVLEAASGDLIDTFTAPDGFWSVNWHPDGALLAAGCEDRNIYIRDAATRREHAVLRGHQTGPSVAGFAAGGDLLVSLGWDWSTRLWDPWAGRELVRFPGMARQVSRDGRRVACEAGWNVTLWEVVPNREYRTLPRARIANKERILGGGFSRDGRLLALGTSMGAQLWDLTSGREVDLPPVPSTWDVEFHPVGDEMLTSGASGVFRWPIHRDGSVLEVGPRRVVFGPGPVQQISLDRRGRLLTAIDARGGWAVDLENPAAAPRQLSHTHATSVATSPNGDWAATGTHKGLGIRIWNLRGGDHGSPTLVADEWGTVPDFSPDGRWLVTTTPGAVSIWRASTWELVRQIRREELVSKVAFSPDGRLLALALNLSGVELIDPATGLVRAKLQAPDLGPVPWMGFSPDGSQLVVSTADCDVRIWDLRRIRDQLREIGLDWEPAQDPMPPEARRPTPVNKVEFVGFPLGLLPQPYFERANESARRGRWAEAAEVHGKALELAPSDSVLWHDDSVLRLEIGDVEAYRRVCRGMLARFSDTRDASEAERLVKTCCLASGALTDYGPVVRLADRALAGIDVHRAYPGLLIARGMADYRAGQYAAAIEWLAKSLSPDTEVPLRDGLAHLFMAMAHHRLGHTEETRRALDRARTVEQSLSKPDEGDLSYDWLRFHVVRREAEVLIARPSG